MAEALLCLIDSANFEPCSAGISCQPVNPMAVEVMNEIGINLSHKSQTTLADVCHEVFDFVITLDEASAGVDHSLAARETVHWKFDNPIAVSNTEAQRRAFRSVRDQIAQRLRLFAIVHVRPTRAERTPLSPGTRTPQVQVRSTAP